MASTPPGSSSSDSSSASSPPTNPPTDARDHLTTLPHEILQNISSCLYASHTPDRELHQIDAHYAGTRYKQPQTRDLANLSRVSKILYQQTNAWAHHFLHTHRDVTKYRIYTTPKAAAKQLPALQKLLQWTSRNCVFCGKTSQREAILANGLHCCRGCDREQWPDKITETEVRKEFKLSVHGYLMHKGYAAPGQASELKKLRYGTYFCYGVTTTMYLRKDVEAYVQAIGEQGLYPVLEKRAARRGRAKALNEEKLRKTSMMLIGGAVHDEGDDDGDEDGDAVEFVKGGVKSGAAFEEPIVIDDD
jgi:hypothetical protein